MMKRITLGLACFSWLTLAAVVSAEVPATLVLRSGERISGDLIDLGGVGFTIRVNGQERRISEHDVAVVEFADAAMSNDIRNRLNDGQQFAVLRGGQIVEGRLSDLGGTSPLRVTLQTRNGQRDLTSAEIAKVYLANPSSGGSSAVATTGDNGVTTVTVQGNEDWTSTNLDVRRGEILTITSSGQVRFSPQPNDTAQAAGAGRQRMGPNAPLPNAPKGALLGRIDQGTPFLIGAQRQVRMPEDGTLYLGVNDDMVSDNDGSLQVTITRRERR
jgi:hypothetical protein